MTEGIVEIRDYTIELEHFPAYKVWATQHAAPWLKSNLDVIEFWMDDGIPADVSGSAPELSPNGQPNVCWIIRWPGKAARDEGMAGLPKNEEWAGIWAKHPCPDAYLHMNARFMKPASPAKPARLSKG
ncbi:MAG: hypothetical protein VYE73_04915 [Acidobacteriota bacterium]|nr:hypothetical protein [Acidobacteriota bacterium]